MGGKIVLVVWEDSEVEELETRRDGGIWSLVLDPKRAPVFSDPWQMLAHAEEVYELRGEVLTYSGWGPTSSRRSRPSDSSTDQFTSTCVETMQFADFSCRAD